MKFFIRNQLSILIVSILLFSCERGELLNFEADILSITLPEDMKTGQPVITNNKIRIPKQAVSEEDERNLENRLKSLTPIFTLTPGATISNGEAPRDFSTPQTYTVISENGKWQKNYEISFFSTTGMKDFGFNRYKLFVTSARKQYHEFYETDESSGDTLFWASGNAGFALTAATADPPEKYPTYSISVGGNGSAAKLVTRSTGALGAMFKMPIAAGNLYLGEFNVSNAMLKPLEATVFGIQYRQGKPLSLRVSCKYQAGPVYKDKDGNILQTGDRPEIYAVLYEPQTDSGGHPFCLNGTNVKTAANIILIAEMNEKQAAQANVSNINTDDYKTVEIPFESRSEFDPAKCAAGKYFITIVFSSSAKGNLFEGAVESSLCIDNARLITEDK